MPEKEVFMTEDGFRKIEDELDELKSVKRKEISQRIKQALEFGDLSENSEYDQAKNDQAQLEEKILKLENMLRNSKIIEESSLDKDVVSLGSIVEVKAEDSEEKEKFMIVGSAEADPFEGKISNESPMGKEILGHKKGQKIKVPVPGGETLTYKILSVKR